MCCRTRPRRGSSGELETTLIPAPEFTISGSIAYLHARYLSFPGAQSFAPLPSGANVAVAIDASGNVMVRSPKLTFNIAPHSTHEMSAGTLDLSANLFHSTRVFWDFANTIAFSQKAYTMLSADLGFTRGRWRFDLVGTNLLDKGVAQQFRPGPQATDRLLERPRRDHRRREIHVLKPPGERLAGVAAVGTAWEGVA